MMTAIKEGVMLRKCCRRRIAFINISRYRFIIRIVLIDTSQLGNRRQYYFL